jgi:predicted transcriptional regulator
MEFQTNTGDCFISDKQLASMFGVSERTISRTIKDLETKGFIVRETKNVKGGRERHLIITMDKMSVINGQNVYCQPTK